MMMSCEPRWTPGRGGAGRILSLTAATLALSACGASRTEAPRAGDSYGAVPPLEGRQVMVMPFQRNRGIPGSPDAELAFALRERGPSVRWVLPDDLREMLRRSPSLEVTLEALPVGVFRRGQVNRVGDPLFGQLRRISALTGAEVAVIPIEIRSRPQSPEAPSAVEITAVLLDSVNGRVFWFGVIEGDPAEPGEARSLASAADALARALVF